MNKGSVEFGAKLLKYILPVIILVTIIQSC